MSDSLFRKAGSRRAHLDWVPSGSDGPVRVGPAQWKECLTFKVINFRVYRLKTFTELKIYHLVYYLT